MRLSLYKKSEHVIVFLVQRNIYAIDTNYQMHKIDNLTNNLFLKMFAHLYDIDCTLEVQAFVRRTICLPIFCISA